MSAENQLYRTKKKVNLRECAIKTPFSWRPAGSQYLTCCHMTMISDVVVKEAQRCLIFRRSGKIHVGFDIYNSPPCHLGYKMHC